MDKRREQINRLAPRWHTVGPSLYIGANPLRHDFLFDLPGPRHVVEIWSPYASALAAQHPARLSITIGDAVHWRTWEDLPSWFGVGMWWHGPEHVGRKSDAQIVIGRMKERCDLVIIGCPNGDYPHGPVDNNPHQAHVSVWTEKDFPSPWEVDSYGEGKGSNLVAVWKR